MNSLGFWGMLASMGSFFFFISSSFGVESLSQQSFKDDSTIQNSALAIAARPIQPVNFATLTKLSPLAGNRYILSDLPRVEFTPRDGWQTLLQEFVRPQLAVQSTGHKFQVQLKGHVVAEVTSQGQANLMIWQLQQMTLNPDFDPQSLRPGRLNATPMGKVEDEVLFWVAPRLRSQNQENTELTAIAWINNLRAALDVPLLSLAEAQSQMYDLVPTDQRLHGTASWYGPYFHGRQTATGEIFDQNDLTAAHPSLPFGTYLKVTNLLTGNRVIVRINDRGPYWGNRSLDLSRQAALCLNSESKGVVPYEAIVMQPTGSLKSTASVAQQPPQPRAAGRGLAGQKLARLIQPASTRAGQ